MPKKSFKFDDALKTILLEEMYIANDFPLKQFRNASITDMQEVAEFLFDELTKSNDRVYEAAKLLAEVAALRENFTETNSTIQTWLKVHMPGWVDADDDLIEEAD